MTGTDGFGTAAAIVFTVITGLALARIVRRRDRSLAEVADDGFHAVMGVAMTAMFWPGGATSALWVSTIGLGVVWPVLMVGLARNRTQPDRASATSRPDNWATWSPDGGPARRVCLGHTGYWLVSGALVLLMVGAGHGSAMTGGPGAEAGLATGPHAGMTGPEQAGLGASALGPALHAMAGWPVWPLVGVTLLIYGARLLFGPRRTLVERICAAVMAAGMATMAFSL